MMLAPIVASLYPFAYSYAMKLLIDACVLTENLSYPSVIFPVILFLGAHLTHELVWGISNIAASKSEPYVKASILLKSYDYVQHHSYAFFQNHASGAISTKLKGLLDGYNKLWSAIHHGAFLQILKVIVSFVALFFVNVYLGLLVFGYCALKIPIMYKLSLTLNKFSFQKTESTHALIGQMSDRLTNIISLFSFASRSRECKALEDSTSVDFIPKHIRLYKHVFKTYMIAGIFELCMLLFMLLFVINLRMNGLITVGDFAFVFGLTMGALDNMWGAMMLLQDLSSEMGDFKSSLAILNVPQQNVDQQNATPLAITTPSIAFNSLSFGYGAADHLLKDFNLTIAPGEKVGLVGHSGAGKTSLIHLLLRYFEWNQGVISISGKDISHVTQDSLRENIAVIPQDTMLFHRSLLENIGYGKPNATKEAIVEASKKAHIHEFIMALPEQYNTYVGERGIKLSGGQRQRIAIARAMLKDAPILVLDEATSALDSQTEKLIQESLALFIKDEKKTVIAIAHRLSTLKHMDRIVVLEQGKITEEGTHRQLIHTEGSLYKKLWELQES